MVEFELWEGLVYGLMLRLRARRVLVIYEGLSVGFMQRVGCELLEGQVYEPVEVTG